MIDLPLLPEDRWTEVRGIPPYSFGLCVCMLPEDFQSECAKYHCFKCRAISITETHRVVMPSERGDCKGIVGTCSICGTLQQLALRPAVFIRGSFETKEEKQ
jgi:hypothetical protein